MSRSLAQASLAADTKDSPRFYSPQLDGLRFIAALLVFIHHAPPLPLIGALKTYGWAGVDMFLCISAFLITRLILLEYERTGSFRLRDFFIRRALRIWPLYLSYATAVCAITLGAGILNFRQVASWWLSHLSFTNNVLTAVKGYSPVVFSSHLWTISLEEQAYLAMPLLLSAFILGGLQRHHALQFCLGGLAVLILARTALVLAGVQHPFIWVLPLRADAFLLGSLAAILSVDGAWVRPRWLFPAGFLLICSIALFPSIDTLGLYQVFGYTLVAAGCTAIVLASQYSDVARRTLGFGPVRYLGKISYGLYVYHLAAIFAATRALEQIGVVAATVVFSLALALSVAMAAISYQILERPFLLLKRRFERVQSRPV